jgi:DNA-binding HxlR family transcriptional regulator
MPPGSRPGIRAYGDGTPVREALERLASKWTILVTHSLEAGPARFNDLKNRLGVSAQALSRVLHDLERDGLVRRQVHAGVPVRVEYSLTPLGGSIGPIFVTIRDWAEQTAPAISAARSAYDRRSQAS